MLSGNSIFYNSQILCRISLIEYQSQHFLLSREYVKRTTPSLKVMLFVERFIKHRSISLFQGSPETFLTYEHTTSHSSSEIIKINEHLFNTDVKIMLN